VWGFLIAATVAGGLIAADSLHGRPLAIATTGTLDGAAVPVGTTGTLVPGGIDRATIDGVPADMRIMSLADAEAAIPARMQQLRDGYAQWLANRPAAVATSYQLPEQLPNDDLPPFPDAPGGEIYQQGIDGGGE
jgi:hypothetical protein